MTTANGWPSLTRYPRATFTAPNGHVCNVASNDLAILFAYLVWRWDTEIEPVTACFGGRTYGEQMRVNRLAPTSNHVSFTAIDVNGAQHPYEASGRGYSTGFTPAQERTLRAILKDTEVLQWGADFPSPYRDSMHIQVAQDLRYLNVGPRVVSAADVKRAATRVGGWVKRVQKVVGVKADGIAGPGTIEAVKRWQRREGLKVDGIFGKASQAKAGWRKAPAVKPATPAKVRANLRPDGDFGPASVEALQRAVGIKHPNSILWSQARQYRRALPGVSAINYSDSPKGCATVTLLQRKIGVRADGVLGPDTIRALQRYLKARGFPRTKVDGVWGSGLSERVQRALNRGVL